MCPLGAAGGHRAGDKNAETGMQWVVLLFQENLEKSRAETWTLRVRALSYSAQTAITDQVA